MSPRSNLPRPQDDPGVQPGSRALAEYVILFFAALGLVLVLASLVVHLLGDFYNELLGAPTETPVE